MTHYGIITAPSTGPLNTMLPLGQELQRRGHRVTLIGIPSTEKKALKAEIEFKVIGEKELSVDSLTESLQRLGELNGLAAFQHTIKLLKLIANITLEYSPEVIKENKIEALLVNQGAPEGGTVADYIGIPLITICSAVVLNREPTVPPFNTNWKYSTTKWALWRNRGGYALLNWAAKPLRNEIAMYRQKWKLPLFSHPNEAYSKLAQISQAPAEFEFPRPFLPKYFHFTGPYHTSASREAVAFPWEKLTGKPLIYASMGTLQNRLIKVFLTIADVCKKFDVQLVISLGGSANPESLPKMPGNPLIIEYAPQLELLQKATLMITHAGMNTTMECLMNGVPMVAIPVTNDQPGVAARIAWTGSGEVIPLRQLNFTRLKKAIGKVLTKPSYKENAVRMQKAIQNAGGVKQAVNIIEQAVTTGKPVYRSN